MKISTCSLLALAAGSALCGTAFAQNSDIENLPPVMEITPGMIQGGDYAAPTGGYGSRVDLTVYFIGNPTATGGGMAGPATAATVYDDVTFGGPGATGPIQINGIAWGLWIPTGITAGNDNPYMVVSFYPNHDNTVAATAQPFSGTPIAWNLNLGTGWAAGAGAGLSYGAPVTFGGAGVLLDDTNVFGPGDRTAGVLQELYIDPALTVRADGWGVMRRAQHTTFVVGSSDPFGWFDGANPNVGPAAVLNNNGVSRSGTVTVPFATGSRGTYLGLQGSGYAPPAPTVAPANQLGCISDAPISLTGSVATNGVTWYSLCLNGGAVDGAGTFLDIDTFGSATDVAIAVYNEDGSIDNTMFDRDSGPGTDAQLSFGIGRRASLGGDGVQFDGRNYTLGSAGLPIGNYYIAVTPNGGSFSDGYGATGSGAGGTYNLRIRTNTNGTPLAASVVPDVLAADALGDVLAPGTPIAAGVALPYAVRWISFSTCRDADSNNSVSIDMVGTDAFGSAMTLFNSSGVRVAESENAAGVPAPLNFNTAGSLPAGNYYLALTYDGRNLAPAADRWHLRSTAGDNGFTLRGTVTTSWGDCNVSNCGTADFDGDGDSGTDADIEAFFACLAGNCCESCFGADFDGDGDTGTDADIEAFFRVLAGQPC